MGILKFILSFVPLLIVILAVVLGTVPLSDTGVASLSTNAFHVGTVAIVAVFLGQEPAVLPENYGDGGPLLTPGPYLQEHLGWNAGFGNTNHYVLTDGKANEAVTRLLAEHLGVPRSQVSLVGGATARIKRFRVG